MAVWRKKYILIWVQNKRTGEKMGEVCVVQNGRIALMIWRGAMENFSSVFYERKFEKVIINL